MFHVFFRQFQFPGFFQKIVHNLRCKAVPVRSSGGLFIFVDSSGNFLKLFGELFLLSVQVQPNSYNCKFYISTFKICTSGNLCLHNLVRLLQKNWDKAKCYRHCHSDLVNRNMNFVQRSKQLLNSICQLIRRRCKCH